jgi:hypothetical protein
MSADEPGTDGPAGADDTVAADADGDGGADRESYTAPLVYLVGFLAFLVSAVAFLADLVTGHDILRSLAVNATAAAVLVVWAAADTLNDPASKVEEGTGAAGVAVMFHGLYLVLAGGVVALTSFRHGRLLVGLALGAAGVVSVVVGFALVPRGAIVDDDSEDPAETGGEPEG